MRAGTWARQFLSGLLVSVAAVALAVAASGLVVALFGGPAVEAAESLSEGAFGGPTQIAGTVAKMVPLILVGLGWIVAISAHRINIGLEGQILAGGIVAGMVGLHAALPLAVHLPLAVTAGAVGGAAWAGIAAWLWARHGVSEVISTLMLNLIAVQAVSWLVRGPLQEGSHTFPRSDPIPATARWPRLPVDAYVSMDAVLALAMMFMVIVLLTRTTAGFSLRLVAANEEVARHAGIRTVAVSVGALLASGALAGLAGSSLVLGGASRSISDNFSANYGFDGIVVALLARNSPAGCLPAALLLAALRQGGGLMEARVGIPAALVQITQAVVILLVASTVSLFDRRRDRAQPASAGSGR